jgi:hypothetical protein
MAKVKQLSIEKYNRTRWEGVTKKLRTSLKDRTEGKCHEIHNIKEISEVFFYNFRVYLKKRSLEPHMKLENMVVDGKLFDKVKTEC